MNSLHVSVLTTLSNHITKNGVLTVLGNIIGSGIALPYF